MSVEVDIFNPQTSVVAHGLEGKTIMLYGTNNVGKTYQAVRASKPYVLACEDGLGAQSGVKYNNITSWRDFKKAVTQFTSKATVDKAKALYDTIIIDEVYASSLFCQKFVCDTYGDGCISLGAYENSKVNLYQIYERVYWEQINLLVSAGYTVIFIAHAEEKNDFIRPKGDKRCINPIIDNCDVVAFIAPNGVDEKGQVIKSSAYFAQTDKFFARSRYDYMVTSIPEFTIGALEQALADGIAKQEEAEGVKSVDFEQLKEQNTVKALSFDELMEEVQTLGQKLFESDHFDAVTEIVEDTLGPGKKVSECTKKQIESVAIIRDELAEKCKEFGIPVED